MTLLGKCSIQSFRLRSGWSSRHLVPRCHTRFDSSIPLRKAEIQKVSQRVTAYSVGKVTEQPWIQPHSLAETLDQHRSANRSGEAINGEPVRASRPTISRAKQRSLKKKQAGYGGPAYKHLDVPGTHPSTEDYGGESRSPIAEWRLREDLPRRLRMPWLRFIDQGFYEGHNVTAQQRLAAEIQACHHCLSPTTHDRNSALEALYDTRRLLTSIPECEHVHFSLIGSRATGLCGPMSDLDLNLVDPALAESTSNDSRRLLRTVYQRLRYSRSERAGHCGFIAHAFRPGRIPLIECTHLPSGLNVQIQCQDSGFESMEMTKAYLAEFPTLSPLFRVIKQMLSMRGLSFGSRGGVTSYPLLHMLVASLKLGGSPKSDVAIQLLEFLKLYSEIDFGAVGIEYFPTITDMDGNDPENPYDSTGYDPFTLQPRLVRLARSSPPYLMTLQDPANTSNDLGKAATLIKHVQATFIKARIQIRNAMEQWDLMYDRGINMQLHGQSILAWCLEGDYSRFEETRRKLRQYGSSQNSGRISKGMDRTSPANEISTQGTD